MWDRLCLAMSARDLRAERIYILQRKHFLLHAEHGSPKERAALQFFDDRLGAIDVVLHRLGLL